jgi:uncharacterized membrane protein
VNHLIPDETERRFEQIMAAVLRAGVALSAATALVGAALYLSRHAGSIPSYRTFISEPADLRSVSGIVSGAKALRGRSVIQLAMLLLIATPVARVVFATAGFLRQRDWTYVVIAATVLALLIYGLTRA